MDEAYFVHYGVLDFCRNAWLGGTTNKTVQQTFNFSRDYIPNDSGIGETKTSFSYF